MADFTRILGAATVGALLAVPLIGTAQTRFQWGNRYDSSPSMYDAAKNVATDANNSAFVVGSTTTAASGMDFLIAKYTLKGQLVWSRTYSQSTTAPDLGTANGTGWETATAVGIDSGSNVFVTGNAYVAGGARIAPIVKLTTGGVERFSITFGSTAAGKSTGANALKVLADGSVLVAGYTNNSGQMTGFVNKYDGFGVQIFSTPVFASASSSDVINSLNTDASGNIIVTGKTTNSTGNQDLFTAKLDSAGTVSWLTTYSTDTVDEGLQLGSDSSGNVYTMGRTNGKGKLYDILLVKHSSAGVQTAAFAWDAQGARKDDVALSLDVQGNGSLTVVGQTFISPNLILQVGKFNSSLSLTKGVKFSGQAACAKPGIFVNGDGSLQIATSVLDGGGASTLGVYTLASDLTATRIDKFRLGATAYTAIQASAMTTTGDIFAVGDTGPGGGLGTMDAAVTRVLPDDLGAVRYIGGKNATLEVPAPGLQSRNTVSGVGVTTKLTDTANGAITINADGSFTYVPTTDYLGGDTFNYKNVNGTWESDWRTANIAVNRIRIDLTSAVPERVGADLVVHCTLTNPTAVTITDLQVEGGLINTTDSTSTFPIVLGSLVSKASVNFDVVFKAPNAGLNRTVILNGSFNGDTFSERKPIIVP